MSYTIEQTREVIRTFERIKLISKKLHYLFETACNQELTKRQQTRQENLIKDVRELARKINLYAYIQTDPRGLSIYLIEAQLQDYTRGIGVPLK
jgi:hypothetical protein